MKRWSRLIVIACLSLTVAGLGGCLVAAGAGAAAGTYEYKNKEALDKLQQQYQDGKISKQEYLQRKKEIEKGSFVY